MENEYNIPLKFRAGQYNLTKLLSGSESAITFSLKAGGVCSYSVPYYGTEVRLYGITEQIIRDALFATYDDNGQLKYIEIVSNDEVRLIYIHFLDNECAKEEILDFAAQSASIISNELIACKEKVARLFIEYFYDGEAVDFAAKIGTVADKQAIIDRLSGGDGQHDLEIVDNCGDYPFKNRIECDTNTFSVMLLCAAPEFRSELFGLAVDIMEKYIKDKVVDVLDKSSDFKFIVSEYD